MTDLLELYCIADLSGVEIDCFELCKRESLSIAEPDGTFFIAIDPFKLTSYRDERMKLAHELGHCVTGSFYNQRACCDVRQKHENRADKWAISVLIPADELEQAVAAGHTELWDLAEYFDVTEDLMRKALCWHTHGNLAEDLYG